MQFKLHLDQIGAAGNLLTVQSDADDKIIFKKEIAGFSIDVEGEVLLNADVVDFNNWANLYFQKLDAIQFSFYLMGASQGSANFLQPLEFDSSSQIFLNCELGIYRELFISENYSSPDRLHHL